MAELSAVELLRRVVAADDDAVRLGDAIETAAAFLASFDAGELGGDTRAVVACDECGETIGLRNPEIFLLGQHQATACPATVELRSSGG